MKSKKEISKLLENKSYKVFEKKIGISLRNGQAAEAIRKTLMWVLK